MIRLNHYVAQAGCCSRRKAVELIKEGAVRVNGSIVTDPATIIEGHAVELNNKPLALEKKSYLLLNKPKDYLTTLSDEKNRKTILELLPHNLGRIYPVGRLDRHTTGLLIVTNDGHLAHTLTHPRFEIIKTYHATLDKPLTHHDANRIYQGLRLADGPVEIDGLSYPIPRNKKVVEIALHCGRNHIVRRIFAHLGYTVKKLNRTKMAGITLHNLGRGCYRPLTSLEIERLKELVEDDTPQNSAKKLSELRPAHSRN